MKVLSKPQTENWRYKTICPMCDSELEIEKSDLKYDYYSGDFREPSYESFHANCVVCNRVIQIGNDKIPKLIKIETKNRFGTNK